MTEQSLHMAAWWRRGLTFLFDSTVIILLWQGVTKALMTQFAYSQDGFWVVALFVALPVVYFLYYFLSEYWFGKTFGKLIARTQVTSVDGMTPTPGQLVRRTFVRMVPIDILSFLVAYPAGWHDVMSSTRVVQRPVSEPVVARERVGAGVRFWRRFWLSLSGALLLSWIAVPAFTVMRWQNPQIAPSDSENWERIDVTGQLSLKLPHEKVRQVAPGLWRTRLTGLQTLEIERFESVDQVTERLRSEFEQLRQAPFTIVKLSEYEHEDNGARGRYRYELDQVPLKGAGFWVTADEGAVYMIRFMGFGVEADAALKAIEDNLAVPQHSTQL